MTHPRDLDRHHPSVLESVEKASGRMRSMSETLGMVKPAAEAPGRLPLVTVSATVACKLGEEELAEKLR